MPYKILIVDDFPDYRKLLEGALKAEGFDVLTAADGSVAIQMAKSERPDLIILDIMMPDVGGPEVRIELMKDLSTKSIPLIFLTGLRPPSSKSTSSAGVKVLGKSDNLSELLSVIRELLGKAVKD